MLLSLLLATLVAAAPAQDSARCAAAERRIELTDVAVDDWRPPPFARGEELHYSATLEQLHIRVHVGSAEMRFLGRDTVRGHTMWKASFTIGGGTWKASVHDTTISWFDSLTFDSHRFTQNLHDPGYHANRDTQIFPDERSFLTKDGKSHPSVADPLDDVSFVYFVRTLPLTPGDCYVFRRYFQPDGNPVVVHVVRRDTIDVPAGRFAALELHPEITTSHLFKSGKAALWLADDSAHTVLRLDTHLGFGSIYLYLRHIGPETDR
jgi:hypothetical protein